MCVEQEAGAIPARDRRCKREGFELNATVSIPHGKAFKTN
jgi:hypothetical protein